MYKEKQSLGTWVDTQRTFMKNGRSSLTLARIAMLTVNDLGFDWRDGSSAAEATTTNTETVSPAHTVTVTDGEEAAQQQASSSDDESSSEQDNEESTLKLVYLR